MGRITAYRIQARRTVAGAQFIDLNPVHEVTRADQREQLDVNFTGARLTIVLPGPGAYDVRVRARDESGAWDSFGDDFTGNAGGVAGSNDAWQRTRLRSIAAAAIAVP
jgi:hypothetical protein